MDVEQIDNILSNNQKDVVQYSDAQWLYLQDNNNNQYSNYIQFITTTLKTQFIDYRNGFFWLPLRIELANTFSQTGTTAQPAVVALRESVLNLISNIIVSTDQGQTIANDINTMFINNIRLVIENNFDWIHCQGSELDFGYDQFEMMPSTSTANNVGIPGSNYQTSNSFKAPQGLEPGAVQNAPLTNDYNEFGNSQLGNFTFTLASNVLTQFNGVNLNATNGAVTVHFPDGRVGVVPYTAASSVLTSLGGITLANYATLPVGLYQVQAIGSTNVLNNTTASELITIPVVINSTGSVASFNTIGGQLVIGPTADGTYTAIANGQMGARNPNYNKGYKDRVTIFQNTSAYQYITPGTTNPYSGAVNTNGTHVYWHTAKIPLALIHDLFNSLNIPIINVGFNIQLFLAQTNGTNPSVTFPPLMTGNNSAIITGASAGDRTGVPTIFYGVTTGGGSGCRLYYRSVKFSPADNARMAQKLTTGFTWSCKYISTDWIVPANNIVGPGQSLIQAQLEQSVVHPMRVWVLAYANNTNLYTLNAAGIPPVGQGSFLQSGVYSTGVVQGFFSQTNMNVNNVPYWRQAFQTAMDQWNQVSEQFNPDTGSMLRYVDWLNYRRLQCFDLTRIADRLSSPTEPVSLQYTGQRIDGLPYSLEMVYLVERQNQITFRFSSSDVAIVVGNLD